VNIEEMNKIKWYHQIDINGQTTPGVNFAQQNLLDDIFIPPDLSGKTVLDIGCWDGYYSFECEKRNAERVVACDKYIWDKESAFWSKDEGFDFAHKELGSSVEKLKLSVEELNPESIGKFDYVLMLSVACLTKNPIQYMEIAKSLCKQTLIIESHIDLLDVDFPAAKYYTGVNRKTEVSDYWGMNPKAIVSILSDLDLINIEYKIINENKAVFKGDVCYQLH